ncbi:hypothetical protein [Streptomyces sp. NPDC056785]|uniref:hypothetical protein n=1 Tax=Streptomyces sp. NPDC056785 TaxID=3345944 RepID=UPI003675E05E
MTPPPRGPGVATGRTARTGRTAPGREDGTHGEIPGRAGAHGHGVDGDRFDDSEGGR